MKTNLRYLIFTALATICMDATAGVIFKWERTSTRPLDVRDDLRPFAVEVSNEVYALAQFGRVTFGQYQVAFNQRPEPAMDQNKTFSVSGLSPDVDLVTTLTLPNGAATTVNNNLTACNGIFSGECTVTLSSNAVNPNATFRSFFNWGNAGNLAVGGTPQGSGFSSFVLTGEEFIPLFSYLAGQRGFETGTFITATNFFGGVLGGSMTSGSGRWVLDRASLVNNVSEPATGPALVIGLLIGSCICRRRKQSTRNKVINV